MKILTSKFGGSSAADADGFRRIRSIVESRDCHQYIVLSAPGRRYPGDEKVTDLLLRGHTEPPAHMAALRRFDDIAKELNLSPVSDIDLAGTRDFTVSRGEYLCAKLFADYCGLPFCDATGLIFFDTFGNVDLTKTYAAVRAMAVRLPCAVIPGFYGCMPDGSVHTFERGGSDITGALIAAAVGADVYENWTDVDGLMSADPRLCADAVVHTAVSYHQMQLLSDAGAQVLHPSCLEPVCRAGIPTVLKNTFHPDRPGTYISDNVRTEPPCVCLKEGLCAIRPEQLGCEARTVLEASCPESFFNREGSRYYALNAKKGCIGRPASLVSAFALPVQQCMEICDSADVFGSHIKDGRFSLLAEPLAATEIARHLHKIISGQGFQNSRKL